MTTTSRSPARLVTAVLGLQLALFIALGLSDAALGVAWPDMRMSFGRSLGDLGLVLAAGTVGYLLGAMNVARVVRAIGTARAVLGATALAALCLAAWTVVSWFPLLALMAAGLGLSRGVTDAGLNAYVALHGGVRRLGLLHGAFGIGTTIGPLLVVVGDLTGSWRVAWSVLAAVHGALALWAWWLRDGWDPEIIPEVAVDHDGRITPLPPLVVGLTLVLFAALVGAEFSTGAWSYTLLTEARGMAGTAAGIAVACYWGGLTIGRFAMAGYGHRVRRTALLRGSCLVALAGILVLWWDPAGLGFLALPVAGLGFAGIFPTLVALMPDRVGASRSTMVIGWSIAMASLGGAAVAALAGVLADRYGPAILAPTLAVATAAVVVIEILLGRAAPVRSAT